MSTDIVIVFIFFAGPIRGYSPGGRVNKFYSHGRRGNSHFVRRCNVVFARCKGKNTCFRLRYSQTFCGISSVQWRKLEKFDRSNCFFIVSLCVRIVIDQLFRPAGLFWPNVL